jgi:xanthine dehydrogenase accessory factor
VQALNRLSATLREEEIEMMQETLQALVAATVENAPVVLATVIQAEGGTPARPGFKLLVRGDGTAQGNVGGGELEAHVRVDAQSVLAEGRPRTCHYTLRESGPDALGMLCGGEVTVFLEPYLPKPVLLIAGGGHIGQPLAELARIVGYGVQVVDSHPERADRPQISPEAVTSSTSVVLITEDHKTDELALRAVLETPAAYIGMIGSRRKVGLILDNLRHDGYSDAQLARVRAPIGLDLGGRQPAEIALSILAEVEAVRHGGNGQPRSRTTEPAH